MLYGVRDAKDPKHAESIKPHLATVSDAASASDVVVFATPWAATEAAIASCGTGLNGKILVDATNPIFGRLEGLRPSGLDSGGEQARSGTAGDARSARSEWREKHALTECFSRRAGGALGARRARRESVQHHRVRAVGRATMMHKN